MPKLKAKREYQPIPWKQLFVLATAKKTNGEPKYSIREIAEKLGRVNKNASDPLKETRALLCRARMGVVIDGKMQKLSKTTVRRGGAKSGQNKVAKTAKPKVKVAAAAPKHAPKVAKKSIKVAKQSSAGVLIAADGPNMLRIEVPHRKNLVKADDITPMLINALDGIGLAVIQKPPTEAPAEVAAEETPVTVTSEPATEQTAA